ncbi:MAG: alkaline phosphatase family protein [Acidobacteria bacterium]|nr:alkaline phosphatase family protein [Acidobacteriota bacterium]
MTLFLAAAISHVLIIGVDGLSSDGVRNAATPNIHKLMERGAWTLRSRGVMPTVSSPNWMSLLSGAGPEMHGVHSNEWERSNFKIAPVCTGPEGIFPGLFGIIHAQKPKAVLAAIHDWQGFGRLVERESAALVRHVKGSPAAAEAAIAYWKENRPLLLFVHLDDVDHAGHGKTWEGPEYKAAVAEIDGLIGKLVDTVPREKTLVVLAADHGGTGTKHGGDTTTELEVPLVFAGPGIAKGEITGRPRNIDMAPTVVKALKLQPHACWEGVPLW